MAVMDGRTPPNFNLRLARFGGVDFSSNETQIDRRRSPDGLNMISDEKFFPVKRTGTECVGNFAGKIYGLHALNDTLLVHAGTAIYRADTGENLYSYMAENFSTSFLMNDFLWILDGNTYLRFDGKGIREVRDIAYIPTTSIGIVPSGAPKKQEFTGDGAQTEFKLQDAGIDEDSVKVSVSGVEVSTGFSVNLFDGIVTFVKAPASEAPIVISWTLTIPGKGTPLEPVNLLSGWRKNSFAGDGKSPVYFLDAQLLYKDSVSILINGEPVKDGFQVDPDDGKISFDVPPPDGKGVDNVIITFNAFVCDCENQNAIDKCTIAGLYGGRNDTRVFLSGNPKNKNRDWQSGLYDPTYFPDTGYTEIGSDSTAIIGYARQYDQQIIIKEKGQDATQWIRSFGLDTENRPYFPVLQGAVGSGAISSRTFANLGDDPLFLSSDGVCAVAGTNVYQQRSIQSRSKLINPRLKAENALKDACAINHDGKYYLFVNGNVYIADGAQGYVDESGEMQYEWYFWDNINASAVALLNDRMYLGTPDGTLLRLKTDLDADAYSDCGKPYNAHWTTLLMDMDNLYRTKTIRDVAYMLMPFSQSDYEIYYRSDRRGWTQVREGSRTLFDFNDLNFANFSFVCNRVPETARTRRKERKAEVFAVKIENNEKSALGILGLEIIYREAGRVK